MSCKDFDTCKLVGCIRKCADSEILQYCREVVESSNKMPFISSKEDDALFERLVEHNNLMVQKTLELRSIVKNSGISKADIADRCDISVSTLNRWLRNGTFRVSTENFMLILWACNYRVEINFVKE